MRTIEVLGDSIAKLFSGKRLLSFLVGLVVVFCLVYGWLHGFDRIGSLWGIDRFPFGDLLNLTGAGESMMHGHDPSVDNPYDPLHRPLNHPVFLKWLVGVLGLRIASTNFVGFLLIFLFFFGLLLALPPLSSWASWVLALTIFSPAVVLGLERANHDLFVFFLICLSISLSAWPALASIVLLVAAFIKLFPVFSGLYLFRFKAYRTLLPYLFFACFLAYFIAIFSDLSRIGRVTGKSFGMMAYGVHTHAIAGTFHNYIPLIALTIGCFLFCLPLARVEFEGGSRALDRALDCFRAGAAIYVGTFWLGNNYNYRFMFLLLAVPQLVGWLSNRQLRSMSLIAISTLVVSMWLPWVAMTGFGYPLSRVPAFLVDEISNWLLYLSLLCLMLRTWPRLEGIPLVRRIFSSLAGRHGFSAN